MSSINARRISSRERAVSFTRASGKRPEIGDLRAIVECDEDVTADGGACRCPMVFCGLIGYNSVDERRESGLNDHLGFLRRLLLDPPEEVMLRLLFRERFESADARPAGSSIPGHD